MSKEVEIIKDITLDIQGKPKTVTAPKHMILGDELAAQLIAEGAARLAVPVSDALAEVLKPKKNKKPKD